MKKILVLASLLFVTACYVKPPPDGDNMGAPTSSDAINKAFADAQSVPQDQAYHVGDTGTLQIIDNVLTNSSVSATHELNVTEINDQYIVYTEHIVETGETNKWGIARVKPTAAASAAAKSKWNNEFLKMFMEGVDKVGQMFLKIEIDRSKSVADDLNTTPSVPLKRPASLGTTLLLSSIEKNIGAEDFSLGACPTCKYYGLEVTKHLVTTLNCAQIPGCKVTATQIKYTEIRKNSDGAELKLKWTHELSKDVPGLFMPLDQCYSTIVKQDDNQIPLTECVHVKDFRFGTSK